jgi:hypothetical protein
MRPFYQKQHLWFMKMFVSIFMVCCFLGSIAAQADTLKKVVPPDNDFWPVYEKMPVYIGNNTVACNSVRFEECAEERLVRFLYDRLVWPESRSEDTSDFRVILTFEILTDSTMTEPTVIRGAGPEYDAEALRVVNALRATGKCWQPYTFNKTPRNIKFYLPIFFRKE